MKENGRLREVREIKRERERERENKKQRKIMI